MAIHNIDNSLETGKKVKVIKKYLRRLVNNETEEHLSKINAINSFSEYIKKNLK